MSGNHRVTSDEASCSRTQRFDVPSRFSGRSVGFLDGVDIHIIHDIGVHIPGREGKDVLGVPTTAVAVISRKSLRHHDTRPSLPTARSQSLSLMKVIAVDIFLPVRRKMSTRDWIASNKSVNLPSRLSDGITALTVVLGTAPCLVARDVLLVGAYERIEKVIKLHSYWVFRYVYYLDSGNRPTSPFSFARISLKAERTLHVLHPASLGIVRVISLLRQL
jgi:hypothetical protein